MESKSSELVIRPVHQSDLPEWSRMRTLLWPDTQDGYVTELEEYFSGDSVDIEETFVVERPGGRLAGFIELNLRSYAEGSRSKPVPYVEGWFVDDDHRGRGIGRALMQRAEAWSLEQGLHELASDTDLDNLVSIKAHKRLGFTETDRLVCFLKKLK